MTKPFTQLTTILIALLLFTGVNAQELDCNVIINADRVQTQERQIFESMQGAIASFLNNTRWTDDEYSEEERIKCNLLINLKAESTINQFAADAQIQSVRPVYGTEYETPIFNFNDSKWVFQYNASDPLIFQENTFTTPLTSLLAYYAYIIIALDYDSFALKGGSPYVERALNILNNTQDKGGPGWNAFGDTRDRYWIIENLNDPQFEPYRSAMYQYHIKGMDTFNNSPDKARTLMLGLLENLKKVNQVKPLSVLINNFFDAKGEELKNIFSKGELETRTKAVDIMVELDPIHSSDYRKLLK